MRLYLFPLLTLFFSCAHHDGPDRAPSSEATAFLYGDHDLVQSSVKEFPPRYEDEIVRHFYFVELKEQTSSYVDRDLHEFEVKTNKKNLPIRVERVLRGRYYVVIDLKEDVPSSHLDFYVGGLKLRENFVVGLKPAHVAHTKVRLIKASRTKARFELVLKDKNGHWVETPLPPEIIPESEVEIRKLEHMGNGIWQITVTYPQGNQLFYLSVRSQGVYFKNLIRFHYVEK